MGTNPAPGFQKYPNHKIELGDGSAFVRISHGGQVIAESRNAILLHEGSYPPRHYIPEADIKMAALSPTAHVTHCPFKGDAAYWTLTLGDTVLENVAWAYPDPFDEMMRLKGHIAFDTDRLDQIETDG